MRLFRVGVLIHTYGNMWVSLCVPQASVGSHRHPALQQLEEDTYSYDSNEITRALEVEHEFERMLSVQEAVRSHAEDYADTKVKAAVPKPERESNPILSSCDPGPALPSQNRTQFKSQGGCPSCVVGFPFEGAHQGCWIVSGHRVQ